MQKVIHTPGLSAVRFTGTFDKKLFELGGRVHPLLKAGEDNIVICTELQALLLSKQAHFEKVNLEDIFANEKTPPLTETEQTETEQTETEQTETEQTETEQTETEPTGTEPTGTEPTGTEPTGTNSTEIEEEYIPPFIEDLNSLSIDDLKKACAYFDITIGNKKIETLQSLLIPFLKNRE